MNMNYKKLVKRYLELRVINPKKKLPLVKWMGYDERFNSWVKFSELKNI